MGFLFWKEVWKWRKIINQNLISYKTVIRGYSKTNEDNKEILIRQKEIIITEVKTTQKNVFLPDKINGFLIGDIGESAFENNDSIERVTLPKQLKNIRKNAFRNCKNLKTINIPSSVSVIEENSFANCTSLKKISLFNDIIIMQ